MIEVRDFTFFLDAWNFCFKHNINWKKSIKRKDWNTWAVFYETTKIKPQ